MRIEHPVNALHGYDRRVVYADGATALLYGALTEDKRAEARSMIEHEFMGTLKFGPQDVPGLKVHEAEIRVSDCVANGRIVFERKDGRPITELDGRMLKTTEDLPESVLIMLKRGNLEQLLGLEAMRTFKITDIRRYAGHIEIDYYEGTTSYIIDPLALAPDVKRTRKGRS